MPAPYARLFVSCFHISYLFYFCQGRKRTCWYLVPKCTVVSLPYSTSATFPIEFLGNSNISQKVPVKNIFITRPPCFHFHSLVKFITEIESRQKLFQEGSLAKWSGRDHHTINITPELTLRPIWIQVRFWTYLREKLVWT